MLPDGTSGVSTRHIVSLTKKAEKRPPLITTPESSQRERSGLGQHEAGADDGRAGAVDAEAGRRPMARPRYVPAKMR
jgi:hypothetical protein